MRRSALVQLPIDEIREELVKGIASPGGVRILLKAPTGSGKSTRVPGFALEAVEPETRVLVVQPRRLACRLLASYVAKQRGVRLGGELGYQVRFDQRVSAETRLVFLTDGYLERLLVRDPELRGVSLVIFDEFHERRLSSDLALAKLIRLQGAVRKDLKIMVMSATLDCGPLREYLKPQLSIETEGRKYPVEMHYRGQMEVGKNAKPLWERAVEVAREAMAFPDAGNGLIFMPGGYEIMRTIELLKQQKWAKAYEILPLHGGLSPEAQDLAVRESEQARLIVATNVAETSLSLPGVRTVIDSGMARVGSFETRRGINTLLLEKIPQASADQRAGRAGRQAPGRAFRLWSEREHAKRAAFAKPEIHRMDLSGALLDLKACGVEDLDEFPWLDAPLLEEKERSLALLSRLGALDEAEQITPLGRRLMEFPLAPRFARLLLAGVEHDCLAEMLVVATAVQAEPLFLRGAAGQAGWRQVSLETDRSDFAVEWRAFERVRRVGFELRICQEMGISARSAREWQSSYQQLEGLVSAQAWELKDIDFERRAESVARAMLTAFGDHVAVRMNRSNRACRLVGGKRGQLAAESVVSDAELFVTLDLLELEGKDLVLQCSRCTALEKEWLGEALHVETHVHFREAGRRVVAVERTQFHDLVLVEKEQGQVDADLAAQELARRVASGELILKHWNDAVDQWMARVNGLAEWMPELEISPITAEDAPIWLEELCRGATSYQEIKEREVLPVLRQWLSQAQEQALEAYLPSRLKLSNGVEVKLRYQAGEWPKFGLKVQHLYGVEESPTLCLGRVPVKVEILAPNQRPWQVTSDLRSFWASGFAQMKKDLAGRYPKHNWNGPPQTAR